MVEKTLRQVNSGVALLAFVAVVSIQFAVDHSVKVVGFESFKVEYIHILGLCLLVLAPLMLLFKTNYIIREKLPILVLVFSSLIAAYISTKFSPYPDVAMNGNYFRSFGFITIFYLYAVFIFFYLFLDKFTIRYIPFVFLLFSGIQALSAYQLLFSAGKLLSGDAVKGTLGQANFFSNIMVTATLLSYFYFLNKSKFTSKVMFSLLGLYFLYPLLSSQSFGSITVAGFMAVLVTADHFWPKSNMKYKRISLVITTILFAIGLVWMTFLHEPSRHLFWSNIPTLIFSRPFIGYGSDTLLAALSDTDLIPGRVIDRSHNIILDVLQSFGIIYFLLAFMTVFYGVRKNLLDVSLRKTMPLLIMVLVFLLTGLVHTKSAYHFVEFAAVLGAYLGTVFSNKLRN